MDELPSSKLGTKSYWDATYERELNVYHDTGDMGEIWFGEDSVERMVDWLEEEATVDKQAKLLDIGCGNGHLLLALAERGYTALTGVDYAEAAVRLAEALAQQQQQQHAIQYRQMDILDAEQAADWQGRFQVVLDKGTYDAISLHPDQAAARQAGQLGPADRYVQATAQLLADDTDADMRSLLLITSCNWTREELIERFASEFDYFDHVRYPTFTFGGQQGQCISTVAFTRKRPQ